MGLGFRTYIYVRKYERVKIGYTTRVCHQPCPSLRETCSVLYATLFCCVFYFQFVHNDDGIP